MWTAQVGPAGGSDAFLQYGALGLLALMAVVGILKLFDLLNKTYERELNRERERSDRLEKQLHDQNQVIQERIVVALTQTAEILKEIMDDQRKR